MTKLVLLILGLLVSIVSLIITIVGPIIRSKIDWQDINIMVNICWINLVLIKTLIHNLGRNGKKEKRN